MVATDGLYTHRFTGRYHTLEPYTMFMGPFFRYLAMPLTSGTFSCVRIGCSAKTFNGWLQLNVFARWLCSMCVPSWIDVILIWYHYIVICMLVTIFNWWLSSKDMKLRVLIKEVLLVFHWLTFCIILLCSLASLHRALFLVQETTQELLNIYIYIKMFYMIIGYFN